ncbi:MAG: tetratricopeptide repeat protein [Candidatus Omnitrophota bacterium]
MKRQHLVWVAFLVLLGSVLYWNSLRTPFLCDEEDLIIGDPRVHHWSRLPDVFLKPFWKPFWGGVSIFERYYRPLITLSFRIDHMFWQFNPVGYHLTNLFFHLLNTLLVYALLMRFFRQQSLSFIGAFLFLAHPAHVEAVTYIPGRVDLISLVFVLSSFHLYLTGRDAEKKIWPYVLSCVSYGLALLSKEMAAFFPLILLGHALWVEPRKTKWRGAEGLLFIGMLFLFVGWFFFRRYVSVQIPLKALLDLPRLPLRLFVIPEILFAYTKIWFFPWPLYVERAIPIEVLSVKTLILEWSLLLFSLSCLLLFFRKRLERFWLLWIAVTLLPVLQIIPIYMLGGRYLFIAEHFLYFSSVGIIGFLSSRFGHFFVSSKENPLPYPKGTFLLGAILVCFSFLVIWRNGDYRDRITFFEQAVRHAPWSARFHNQLGLAYLAAGDPKTAEEKFLKAISLDPMDHMPYINVGFLYKRQGEMEKARKYFQKAFELMPEDPIVLYNLGNMEAADGRWEKALPFYEKALKANPDYMCAYSEKAHAYWELGEKEKALEAARQGLARDPESPIVQNIKRWIEERLRKE